MYLELCVIVVSSIVNPGWCEASSALTLKLDHYRSQSLLSEQIQNDPSSNIVEVSKDGTAPVQVDSNGHNEQTSIESTTCNPLGQ